MTRNEAHTSDHHSRGRGPSFYKYDCYGETISYAESLGFVDDVKDEDWTADEADGLEQDAIDYIEAKGIKVVYPDDEETLTAEPADEKPTNENKNQGGTE